MSMVTVSPKFQITIPEEVRYLLNIRVGQKLMVRVQGKHIELYPVQPISFARGFLSGLEATVEREADRV